MDQVFEWLIDSNSIPKEDATIPFPNDDVTPPVTKMYFVVLFVSIESLNQWLQNYE